MSAVDVLLGNLRSHGIEYLVCIAALVFAFKHLGDYRKPRKFVLLGASLLLGAMLGGAILSMLLHAAFVGTPDPRDPNSFKRHVDALNTLATLNSILAFVLGLTRSAGLAAVLWAVFVDKVDFAAKPKRRRRRDEDEEDEEERPRRRRIVRQEDEEEDDEPRPRRRRPREDD